ncbi:MAG TPA: polysaccharide pyruvyl transferase family protein [Gemmatimonadaceae bacterium]|nr:polysaccharide pyruvyl transferase family protein [Gemmatimonadaceae bacterium]
MRDRLAAVQSLRTRLLETLRPVVAHLDAYALIDFPNYANVGDSAIYLGQLEALRALGAPRPRFICDFRTFDRAELARRIGRQGTILLTGGGSFGDLWPTAQDLREEIVRAFPGNPIVQLPQTIHFEKAEALQRARSAFNAHDQITLLVRDGRSLEIAGNELTAQALLCPDMAFALGTLDRPRRPVHAAMWLLRTDKESATGPTSLPAGVQSDWLDEPPTRLRSLSYALTNAVRRPVLGRLARPLLRRVYEPLARQRLRRGLHLLAAGRVVVTDRLHGHILSLLLDVPHVVLDNSYGKLASFVATWTNGIDGVHRAGSIAEAAEIAAQLLTTPAAVAHEPERA